MDSLKELCRFRCGYMGELACWEVMPDDWPNQACDCENIHQAVLEQVSTWLVTRYNPDHITVHKFREAFGLDKTDG